MMDGWICFSESPLSFSFDLQSYTESNLNLPILIFLDVLYTAKLTPDVSPTEDIIRPYLSTSTPQDPTSKKPVIVLIQNGVGIEDSVYEALVVKDKLASGVISCVAWIGTNLIQGGTVVEHGALVSGDQLN